MHFVRRAPCLLPFALLLLTAVPWSAYAAVTTTYTNASPQGGITIFNYPDQSGTNYADENGIWGNSKFTAKLLADVQADLPSLTATQIENAGISEGGGSSNQDTVTENYACTVLDSAWGAGQNARETYLTGDNYASGGKLLKYTGSAWTYINPGGDHTAGLKCISYALPQPSFSASDYSITAGQSVTLSWSDSTARDYDGAFLGLNTTVYAPSAEAVVGGSTAVQTSATNDDIVYKPLAVCTSSSNWSNQGLTGGSFSQTHVQCGTPTEPDFCTRLTWVPDNTTLGEVKKAATVTLANGSNKSYTATQVVSPTVTTTYTYTCTNVNGTTKKSLTVSVIPALSVTCTASDTVVSTGDTETWTANPTGGSGTYTYAWSGGTPTAISGTAKTEADVLNTAGTQKATVTVTSSDGQTAADACPNVTVYASPTASLTATPTSITSGGSSLLKWSSTGATSCTGTGFSTGGATSNSTGVSVSPTANTTYTISCKNAAGKAATDTATVTVTAAKPDLTAGDVATVPVTVVAGTPTALSGLISSADAGTGAGFTDLFEMDNDATHTLFTDIYATAPYSSAALGAGASNTATASYTFPTEGTWYLRLCADTNSSNVGTISESNENNNCSTGGWTAITVNPPSLPDFVPTNDITPNAAVKGSATTFKIDIKNQGGANAGATTALLQRATSASGANATDVATAVQSAENAGTTRTISFSYTYPASGTWYMRACADKSSGTDTGSVSESDENNNCSAWVGVTVTVPTLACSASGTSIDQGSGTQTVTYTASPTTASPYAWTASDGATGLGTSYSATRDFSSVTPGIYGMTVSGSGYASANCPQVTVTNSCPAANITLTASKTRVNKGDTTTLSWAIPSVTPGTSSCTLAGTDGLNYQIPVPSCSTAVNGSKDTGAIQGQTTYTLTCGSKTAKAIVDVTPNFNEF